MEFKSAETWLKAYLNKKKETEEYSSEYECEEETNTSKRKRKPNPRYAEHIDLSHRREAESSENEDNRAGSEAESDGWEGTSSKKTCELSAAAGTGSGTDYETVLKLRLSSAY